MAAPKSKTAAPAKGKVKMRKKEKKNIAVGKAFIKSTFNNTIISITDPTGAVISWSSSGQVGYKGSRKSTPFAAQLAAEAAARRAQEVGREPARGAPGRPDLRRGAPSRAASGPRRDPRRRNARP